jgi:hypothetical protein
VVEERVPEISVDDVVEPGPVLLEERFVEAELMQEERPVLRGLVGTEDCVDRVPGQKVNKQERQDGDQKEDYDELD